ncbi:hypothetical protein [Amaricoccus tamworthensis]|uniref:hypothetical protein n=1 Tax=Amaricoccus tamworthensis TaxID=57002 RepID=UPI003C7AFC17
MRCRPLKLRTGLATAGILLAVPAWANDPRSAIPWLSESVSETGAVPEQSGNSAFGVEEVTTTVLSNAAYSTAGILSPQDTGFNADIWGPTDAATALTLVREHGGRGVPETIRLFKRILLAATPTPGSTEDGRDIFVARLDRLLELGALEETEALIGMTGAEDPAIFRRWFDVGLLSNHADAPCRELRRKPTLSPTLPARIFCLARGGDWGAAEITLTMGQEVDAFDPAQHALLARFLDPELFEEEPAPEAPDPLTPLDFLMREAVGLPRPAARLPLAFLHFDLDEHAPLRIRAEAAERLVLATTVSPEVLFEAYRSAKPAASGGIWDRVAATQDLDAALADSDQADLPDAILAADEVFTERGLRSAFAYAYGPQLSEIDRQSLPQDAQFAVLDLLLLAGETDLTDIPADYPNKILVDLANGQTPQHLTKDPVSTAVKNAFAPTGDPSIRDVRLQRMLREKRQGEALFAALDLLQGGTDLAPDSLRSALLLLRKAGQEETARKIAIQTVLGSGRPD